MPPRLIGRRARSVVLRGSRSASVLKASFVAGEQDNAKFPSAADPSAGTVKFLLSWCATPAAARSACGRCAAPAPSCPRYTASPQRTASNGACAFSIQRASIASGAKHQPTALFRSARRVRGPCTNSRRHPSRPGPRQPRPPRRRHQRRSVIRTVGKTPCTCPVARHCITSAGQHPVPNGARDRCRHEGSAYALSSRAAPSHAEENETMMRRPVWAARPQACRTPQQPAPAGESPATRASHPMGHRPASQETRRS